MKYLVVGAGLSGYGACSLLVSQGHQVTVTDRRELNAEEKQRFLDLGVALVDGTSATPGLDEFQTLVISPGVPPSNPIRLAAARQSIPTVSELDLVLPEYDGKIALITGTNGKSTTCAMLYHFLWEQQIPATLVGNIGAPPSLLAAQGQLQGTLVVEVSSYQLASSHTLPADFAVITNLSEDHLAYHGDMASYLQAKLRVFEGLKRDGKGLIHQHILATFPEISKALPKSVTVFEDTFGDNIESLSFFHDRLNAAVALTAFEHLTGCDRRTATGYLKTYKGLPHRCESFYNWRGVTFVDDSKATNVDATRNALKGQKGPLVLWLGGQGKGESFQPIAQHLPPQTTVIAFGASRSQIERDLSQRTNLHIFPTLNSALQAAPGIIQATPQLTVLFSPACASFDEFANFEERGRQFQKLIRQNFT